MTSSALSGLFPLGPNASLPSTRYVALFNRVAGEIQVPLRLEKPSPSSPPDPSALLRITDPDARGRYGETGSIPSVFNNHLVADFRRVVGEMESRRRAKVEASSKEHDWIPYRAPIELLTGTERAAVHLFANKVKPVIDRIEARQQDPHAMELAAWMVYNGDRFSRLLFERFHRDTAAGSYVADEEASLFPFFPDRPLFNGMIDEGITPGDLERLSQRLPPDAEALRPTTRLVRMTVVETTNGGRTRVRSEIEVTPLPLDPAFQADHLELAAALEEIADLDTDGQLDLLLQDQLRKWARFFRSGTAEDEEAAVQATIDAGEGGGNLRVHLGPSESYWADNIKFDYLLQVGIRDQKLTAELANGAADFQALEDSLAGIDGYTPRQLSTRGGFADPIYTILIAGFYQTYARREPLGNNFPNYDYPGVKGSNRFINLEGLKIAAEQMKIAMGRLLEEDISGWDAQQAVILDVIDHESGHLVGPPRNHITPIGVAMGIVFGDHWGSGDEPMADMTGPVRTGLRFDRGEITWEEAVNLLRGTLAFPLSNRYKGKQEMLKKDPITDHYFGHILSVGYFFKREVLTIVDTLKGRRFRVDYRKLLDAARELQRAIVGFQAVGDLGGYLKFGREMAGKIPDEADRMILEANKDLPMFFIERYI